MNVCLIIRLSSDTESSPYTVQCAREYHWSLCQNSLDSEVVTLMRRAEGDGDMKGGEGRQRRQEMEDGETVKSIGETFLLCFLALISGLYRLHGS